MNTNQFRAISEWQLAVTFSKTATRKVEKLKQRLVQAEVELAKAHAEVAECHRKMLEQLAP